MKPLERKSDPQEAEQQVFRNTGDDDQVRSADHVGDCRLGNFNVACVFFFVHDNGYLPENVIP
jgi:hypothetical protein